MIEFIDLAVRWFYAHSHDYPLSVELSRLGKAQKAQHALRVFPIKEVKQIVGKVFHYDLEKNIKVKKKRVLRPAPIPVIRIGGHIIESM